MSLLKSQEETKKHISDLGQSLTKELLASAGAKHIPPLFVCLGDESFIFFSDLIRKIEMDIHCEFIFTDGFSAAEKGEIKFLADLKDRDVIYVTSEMEKATVILSEKIKTVSIMSGAKSARVIHS